MSFIDIEGVGLTYGRNGTGTPAIADASLSIARGEFVALVGPSGCGKSTLLKLVAGLVEPSAGRVRVNGREARRSGVSVGMAFQNPTLLPWRTIRDNILLPLEIAEPHRRSVRRDRDSNRARADELLAAVGLAGFGDKMPPQLSGGMQQRAQLCRALIHRPAILLLDEPFAALDTFTREELWAVLQALWQSEGCTVVLVTHELREAVYLAETVYVMSARPGRIVKRSAVDIVRPRTLETSFEPCFVDIVHDLRHAIGEGMAP